MNLQELKVKDPEELLKQADELGIESPSSLRKQDLMFSILKQIATEGETITGLGVIEIMQDGFGFLRSSESNYLPGPDDIYVSPSQIKKFSLRTGDSIEGEIRAPKNGERYFALIKINKISDATIILGPEGVFHSREENRPIKTEKVLQRIEINTI